MASTYSQATVSPCLPESLFGTEDRDNLASVCGLTAERDGDRLYFVAEVCFSERGEDEHGATVDCLCLMQRKLRQLDPVEFPHITIQGSFSCSEMRPDEFGGFAHLITRDAIRSFSTSQWLQEQTRFASEDRNPPWEKAPMNSDHPWRLRVERDGTEDLAVICDADGEALCTSRPFWLPRADDPTPPTLAAMRLMHAAPALLAALRNLVDHVENESLSLEQLKDQPETEAEAKRAWRAVETARALIARLPAIGFTSEPNEPNIHSILARRRQIAVVWSVEDVLEVRPDLTPDQAWEVLEEARNDHDATIGINWDVLDCHADMLFGDASETNYAV